MAIPAINVLGNPNVTEGNFQIAIEDLRKSVIGSGKAYDSANTYSQYDTCVSGGIVYYSKINSNTGNTPAVDANWGLASELIKLIASPTTNALAKINANGTIGNSGITTDASNNLTVPATINGNKVNVTAVNNGLAENIFLSGLAGLSNGFVVRKDNAGNMFLEYFKQDNGLCLKIDSFGDMQTPYVYNNTTASAANIFMDSLGKFYRSTSSRQYKTDIETIDNSYVEKFFDNARPIYYKSLSNNDNPNWGYWGFIAEEIAEFDKRLVHWRYQTKEIEVEKERIIPSAEEQRDDEGKILVEAKDETVEKYIEIETVNDESKPMIAEGVMYERITVLLTAKVQEQQKIINDLKARIEALESK